MSLSLRKQVSVGLVESPIQKMAPPEVAKAKQEVLKIWSPQKDKKLLHQKQVDSEFLLKHKLEELKSTHKQTIVWESETEEGDWVCELHICKGVLVVEDVEDEGGHAVDVLNEVESIKTINKAEIVTVVLETESVKAINEEALEAESVKAVSEADSIEVVSEAVLEAESSINLSIDASNKIIQVISKEGDKRLVSMAIANMLTGYD